MDDNDAANAALLTLIEAQEAGLSTRECLLAAIAIYEEAALVCSACRGTGSVVKRGCEIYLADGHRASSTPVSDGDEMVCVTCGGQGVDLKQAVWCCTATGWQSCSSDATDDDHHADCGWVRRPRADEAGRSE